MRVDLFDYALPPERIALAPVEPRDSARLLVVEAGGALRDQRIVDLPDLLRAGDLLVVNDAKVIAARLIGRRWRGQGSARIEATLIKRLDVSRWQALARPAKALKAGDRVAFGQAAQGAVCLLGALDATVVAKGEDGEVSLSFDLAGPALDDAIDAFGQMPLPPYIASRRAAGEADRADYQTLFAASPGAVAAPTAGLHFTPDLVARLAQRSVAFAKTTLLVGAGTFLPVKTDDTDDHLMHSEWGCINAEAAASINDARRKGGRVVAVGTTSLRLLETAARENGEVAPFEGETSIFITPGYRFKSADMLLTNFHLPRSTLLMLVSAFAGMAAIRSAYAHAIAQEYRFYSYGDACLLTRAPDAGPQ